MTTYDYDPDPSDDDEAPYNAHVAWTQNLINSLSEGGTWAIPRSGTLVTVHHSKKLAVFSTTKESLAEFYFKQLGFTISHD
jgi:hypothetical protein